VKTFLKIGLMVALALLLPAKTFACAACYNNGAADSPLTDGMNWGIFTLLGVVITVLATILVFFVHIIRKGEAMAAAMEKSAKPIEA
jgi:lipoprotein signal peptidase